MNLDNCPRCGKLFAKNFRDVCPSCVRDIDKEYELCANYLREFKGSIITEVADATGVSVKQITKFIREGRISIMNAPNMSYPCESCGNLIREQNLCENCRQRIEKDKKQMFQDIARKEDLKGAYNPTGVYKGLDRYKDNK
ncbi:flagellar operon protein (TIGR03826 family) [Paenibacillus endophyticus]|uniref:Flagellar operon protein (TIGR03826 family) n=1 Tax=Paenibacillus endophyticus TaxID=1294268 RepID=A0A7W5CBG5_9BACL|nr:TIGR03826 family flagellar region protein [Paenibacillus endophyticus]MBB3154625.1 flagellar operon protein (TIGR03826 family) [Paenibacillus endophyticus]